MKSPEEFLSRGHGRFINCTDYDDAVRSIRDYAGQLKEFIIDYLRTQHDDYLKKRDGWIEHTSQWETYDLVVRQLHKQIEFIDQHTKQL